MEHRLLEQKRQLEYGIDQILQTHVRVANGDFGARAPLTQDNVLFQIGSSLNNLLNRLGRAAQSEYVMKRTVDEIHRLRDSLQAARSGRKPLWPAPSGTPVDMLLDVIAGPARGPAIQPPGSPGMQGIQGNGAPPQFGSTSGPLQPPTSSRLGGYGPYSGPQDPRRPGGYYPGQPGPSSGPQGPTGYGAGQPGQTGQFSGPLGGNASGQPVHPPSTAGLNPDGQRNQPSGADGFPARGPNSFPPTPQPPNSWDMPPLPDLADDNANGG
jgi:hypothetical protein